jgi:pyruvate/2-oxoglutarate dehydrogenase complex dihydrolipoamide dehydrogenase (E3) component
MPHPEYDLAIIGAGSGGLIAARFAVQLGARVLLTERDRIGGDCTWTGCVPSKSLIRVAKAVHEIRTAQRFGIEIDTSACAVDMNRVRDYVQSKVQQIYEPTAPAALTREGIEVAIGPTSFEDDRTLRVGDRSVRARRYLICTGATPVAPPVEGLDGTPHFTYHNIFENAHLPASLVVIGGGPLGTEMAQAYGRLGSQVTVVTPRLLPHDDPEAAEVIRRVFVQEGIRLVEGRAVSAVTAVRADSTLSTVSTVSVNKDREAIAVTTDNGQTVKGECLLVAAGRRPNVDGLALERAGVAYSQRGIAVDDRLRTNVPHIYAAGDVLGREQFSHVAGWQAFEATRNALLPGSASGRPNPMAWVTFTDPEVAQVGLTESAARERFNHAVTVTRWQLARVDRARCDDDEDGFIKVLSDDRGRIIGATIVASRAGELSGELSLAIARRLTVGDMATAVHAYPTYATALQQVASEVATSRWTASATGRFIGRLMGFSAKR